MTIRLLVERQKYEESYKVIFKAREITYILCDGTLE